MHEVPYVVLIPARWGSSRLPQKPLLDLAGLPMVVRVARQALASQARDVVVATDDDEIASVCQQHGVRSVMTEQHHPSGSDRLAEACVALGLDGDDIVVNVQGDEPLIDPALVRNCAELLARRPECAVATAAHAIEDEADFRNPNVVKVVCDAQGRALYFSRAPIPWWRDGSAPGQAALPPVPAWRHIGLYAYRAATLRRFPTLSPAPLEQTESLEQLRILWHGDRIAVFEAAQAPAALSVVSGEVLTFELPVTLPDNATGVTAGVGDDSRLKVGTPIGNLSDLSPRARHVLSQVQRIACEDTRRSGLLLHHLGLREGETPPRLVSFHAHNQARRLPELLDALASHKGEKVVLNIMKRHKAELGIRG